MKKNHSHKSRSKKNRNYKNVKEYKNMKKIGGVTELIMQSKQTTHEKIPAIAKAMFDMAELDTNYINQGFYRAFIEEFFERFDDEPEYFCNKVLTEDTCFHALEFVLTANKAFVEKYNRLSYGEQFPLFLQLVSLLTCCNYTDREKLLLSVLAVSYHAVANNDEGVAMRARQLYSFLLDPISVKQEW